MTLEDKWGNIKYGNKTFNDVILTFTTKLYPDGYFILVYHQFQNEGISRLSLTIYGIDHKEKYVGVT